MATIVVEGLPDRLLERLAGRAAEHGRCLNGELLTLIVRALAAGLPGDAEACWMSPGSPAGTRSPGAQRRQSVGWGADAVTTRDAPRPR
jgi:hypothetical protein